MVHHRVALLLLVVLLSACARHANVARAPAAAADPVVDLLPADGVRTVLASGHTADVVAMAASRDHRWLATGDAGGVIKLRDAASLREVATALLPGAPSSLAVADEGDVVAATVSGHVMRWHALGDGASEAMGDGRAVAIARDGTVAVAGKRLTMNGAVVDLPNLGDVVAVAFDEKKGTREVVVLADNGSWVRVREGAVVAEPQRAELRRAVLSADASTVAGLSRDGIVIGPTNGKPGGWDLRETSVSALALSADGATLFLSYDDLTGRATVSDLASDPRTTHEVAKGKLTRALVDGGRVFGAAEHDLRAFDLDGAHPLAAPASLEVVTAIHVAPDGRRLFVVGKRTATWTIREQLDVRVSEDELGASALGPGAELLARTDQSLQLFRTSTGASTARFAGSGAGYDRIAFMPDGQAVIAGHANGGALSIVTLSGNERAFPQLPLPSIESLAIREDGALAALGSKQGWLVVQPLPSGPPRVLLHGAATSAVAFAKSLLASAHDDGTVRLWDGAGAPLRTIEAGAVPGALAFRRDGAVLAAVMRDGAARLFAVESGAPAVSLPAVPSPATAVAFLPDGHLAIGHADGRTRIWDVKTPALLVELATTAAGEAIVLARDGRFESASHVEQPELYGMKGAAVVPWEAWSSTRRRSGLFLRAVMDRAPVAPPPETVVQRWPGNLRGPLVFDPSGEVIATPATDETLLFDVRTGALGRRVRGEGAPRFSPDGRRFAAFDGEVLRISSRGGNRLLEREVPRSRVVVGWTSNRNILVASSVRLAIVDDHGAAVFSEDVKIAGGASDYAYAQRAGRLAAIAGDWEGPKRPGFVQLWHVEPGKAVRERELRCSAGALAAIALSEDGRILACADRSALVVVVDLATGRRTRWRPGPYDTQQTVYSLAIHPDGRTIAAGTLHGTFAFDLASGVSRHVSAPGVVSPTFVAISPDGSLLGSMTNGGELDLLDLSTWQTVRSIRPHVLPASVLAVDSRMPRLMVAADADPLDRRLETIWDARDGASTFRDEVHGAWTASFAPDRDVLVTATARTIRALEGPVRKPLWTTDVAWSMGVRQVTHAAHAAKLGGSIVALVDVGVDQHAVVAFDPANGAVRWKTADLPGRGSDLVVSPDGALLAVTSDHAGDSLHVLSADMGRPVAAFADARSQHDNVSHTTSVAFASGNLVAAVDFHRGCVRVMDIAAMRLVVRLCGFGHEPKIAASPATKTLAVTDREGNLVLFDTDTWREREHTTTRANAPAALAFFGDGRALAVLDKLGTVHVVNMRTLAVSTLAVTPSGAAALVSDSGEYLAPRDAAGVVAFRWGDRAYPFEQFDASYNDPANALARLGLATPDAIELHRAARARRLARLGVSGTKTDGRIPTVSFAGAETIATDKQLRLRVSAIDPARRLKRLHVIDNGVPLFGEGGKPLALTNKIDAEPVDVELVRGPNKLQVYVENEDGTTSLEATAVTTYGGPASKPALHVFAVGVTRYKDRSLDLTFPAKDAHDVASAFCRGNASACAPTAAFEAVRAIELTDDRATKLGVLALRSELERTRTEDVVVLYLSGHGALDRNGEYFFAPHDINTADLARTGVPYASIEALLDRIPARKKLLVMDTCNAGELEPDEVAEVTRRGKVKAHPAKAASSSQRNLFADLRRGTGAHVLASASGAEYSFEDPQWKNSVFTYAFLRGIVDRQADPEGRGEIRVSALRDYVAKTVTDLTDGHQTPNARRQNLEADFDLVAGAAPTPAFADGEACPCSAGGCSCKSLELAVRALVGPAEAALATPATPRPDGATSWTSTKRETSPHRAARFEARLEGYAEPLAAAVVTIVPDERGGSRVVTCTALDAMPEVVARCDRAIAALARHPMFATLPP